MLATRLERISLVSIRKIDRGQIRRSRMGSAAGRRLRLGGGVRGSANATPRRVRRSCSVCGARCRVFTSIHDPLLSKGKRSRGVLLHQAPGPDAMFISTANRPIRRFPFIQTERPICSFLPPNLLPAMKRRYPIALSTSGSYPLVRRPIRGFFPLPLLGRGR